MTEDSKSSNSWLAILGVIVLVPLLVWLRVNDGRSSEAAERRETQQIEQARTACKKATNSPPFAGGTATVFRSSGSNGVRCTLWVGVQDPALNDFHIATGCAEGSVLVTVELTNGTVQLDRSATIQANEDRCPVYVRTTPVK